MLLAKHFPGDEIKEAERRQVCGTYGKEQKYLQGVKTSKVDVICRIKEQIRIQFIKGSSMNMNRSVELIRLGQDKEMAGFGRDGN
jgi:hypothetical protein